MVARLLANYLSSFIVIFFLMHFNSEVNYDSCDCSTNTCMQMLSWLVFVLPSWSLHFVNGSHCTDAILPFWCLSQCCERTPRDVSRYLIDMFSGKKSVTMHNFVSKKKYFLKYLPCFWLSVWTAEWKSYGDLKIQCKTDKAVNSLMFSRWAGEVWLSSLEVQRRATATKA